MYHLSNSTANFIFILIRAQLSKLLAFKLPVQFRCSYLNQRLSRYSKWKIVDRALHSINHSVHRHSHSQSPNADGGLLDRETRKLSVL